jgi:hypothetical protein
VFSDQTAAWNGTSICGVLLRHALLDVCIYASAPARLAVHPHLKIPPQAAVNFNRNFQIRFENSEVVAEYSIGSELRGAKLSVYNVS